MTTFLVLSNIGSFLSGMGFALLGVTIWAFWYFEKRVR